MAPADLQAKLAALSPEKRQQLLQLLAAKRGSAGASRASNTTARPTPAGAIPRAPAADDYPLSFAQKRLWLQEQLIEGKTAAYNVSLAVEVRGDFSVEAFERAFRALIQRHAVLRTRVVRGEAEPRQGVCDEVAWDVMRWAGAKPDEAPAQFRARAEALANRPFDLARELPLRVACMQVGEARHGLAMVFHHIACDGSSVPLLIAELGRLYARARAGEELRVADAPALRYVDYAVWHRGWLESAEGVKARNYWLNQFAELPVALDLPADFSRPAVQDFSGGHLAVRFDSATRDALVHAGQRAGASLFMTLQAVVVAFLHRYAGSNDVTLGAPTEGRLRPELEPLVGFFVNTLALRTRIEPEDTFATLLKRVRDGVLDAFEHQGCPFDVLVESLPLERDVSRPPLFNVMLGLNRAADEAFRLPGVEAEVIPLARRSSKVDLTFHFLETTDGLALELEYATSLFTEARMRRVAEYFSTLLRATLATPDVAVGDLPLMPADLTRALIRGFNPPNAGYPRERSLVELFREQVARDPSADAVYFRGRAFSYAEVDRMSDAIAARLIARVGMLRPEEPVALQVERSERMIAALVGILKAGGCYLPLNPGTPDERVRTLLTMAGARVRLIEEAASIAGWGGLDLDLRTCAESPAPAPAQVAGWRGGGPRQLACIIFTSGSTGEPKGVLVEQRAVVRLVRGTDFLQLGAGDRVLQTGSLAFDASTFEIWGPLLNGGCCCLPEGKEILEIEQFAELLRTSRATTCFLTTGLFNQIADFHPEAFASLSTLLTGGEKVSVAHINRVLAVAPKLRLLHVYGPTENTTFSSWHAVRGRAERDVPIGRAIAHSTLYILDSRGNLLPPGVAGEIYCGGEGLARGYLGRPDLTADRFVPDPFSERAGARLYRTGDVGCWNERGEIEFIGRNDDQVKIRGFRIELGEIELRLRALSGVQQAVVVARPSGGTHELVAYIVGSAGLAEEKLRPMLGATLPDYMVPAHFVLLDALPLNASGKVDRRALPEPERTRHGGGAATASVSWTTPAERALAEAWADVLGRAPGGPDAHYFNSGGDSIKAIQMAARLRARGFRLTLREVFSRPRFADLARAVARHDEMDTDGTRVEETGDIPLTPIQRWFLETHTPPFDHFNQATLLVAAERLDAGCLRRALETLLARHAMLRCRLERGAGGDWRQRVEAERAELVWREEELRAADAAPKARRVDEIGDELHGSLSLREGRLVAAALLRGGESDELLLVIHHWAVDGISWRILVEELEEIYRALARRSPTPERRSSAPFRAWAQALQSYARSAKAQSELRYWSELARRLPAWNGGAESLVEAPHTVTFSAPVTEQLLTTAHRPYGTQATDLLLAALSRAWERRGAGGVLLAMEGHGRETGVASLDVSRTVGWFTSMWPFLLDAHGAWDTRIRRVKDARRAVPERGVGFGALRHLGASDEGQTALVACGPRVSFNYLGVFDDRAGGLFRGVWDAATGRPCAAHLRSPFALDVVAEVSGGCLRASFQFHQAVFDAAGRAALAADFSQALRECLEHCATASPKKSLSDLTGGVATLEELEEVTAQVAGEGLEVADVLPLTPMQEGMVFHAVQDAASGAYADQVVLRLRGSLHREPFEAAWHALGEQYPNLGCIFVPEAAAKPVAVVPANARLGFSWFDATQEAIDVGALRRREREKGFDVRRGPLLRLMLVRLEAEHHEAIVGFHHSVLDGWSAGRLWEQLAENYRALAAGAALPGVAASFRDYLAWLGALDAAAELSEWRKSLAGCPVGTAVPPGRPRLGAPGIVTRSVSWELGRERTELLTTTARRLGVTDNSLLQALWGVFLGKLNRATDVVFGATLSGRNERVPHVEAIVGLLIHTVPVRVTWTPATTFAELAEAVRGQMAASFDRARVSLADIQNAVLESGALIQHVVVFENYPTEPPADAPPPLWQLETVAVHDPMHFEFGVLVVPKPGGWICRIVADRVRYPDAYLAELQRAWEDVVDGCLREPARAIEAWTPGHDPQRSRRIVVAATFTAEPIEDALAFWLDALGCAGELRFAPFNQVLQQLLDPRSELHRRGVARLILARLEDWAGPDLSDAAAVDEALELNGDVFIDGMRRLAEEADGGFTLVVFTPASALVRRTPPVLARIEAAEARLARRIEGMGGRNIRTVRVAELTTRFATADFDDGAADDAGGVPYTEAFFAAVATELIRRWEAHARAPVKVLALDADNTLWRGVLGEDGVDGIQLTPAHRRLQLAAKSAREQGRLLALVSKNNRDELEAAFAARADFPLRWDDFARIEAGWRPKSESLRAAANALNLGLDSFVLLDDSAMECGEVREALPEVLCLQLPDTEDAIDRFLTHLWVADADPAAATAEDRQRSELYRAEAQREMARRASGGIAAFVRQLNLALKFVPIDASNLARAAQLTQRTNQFNASTRRRTEEEVRAFVAAPGNGGWIVDVTDRFGAYGLTGCVLYRSEARSWKIDTLLLSCRVLGRGVEHQVMRRLAADALAAGVEMLEIPFTRSGRNTPAEEFLRTHADAASGGERGDRVFQFSCRGLLTLDVRDEAASVSALVSPGTKATATGGAVLPAASYFHQTVATQLATMEGMLRAIAEFKKRQRARAEAAMYEAPQAGLEAQIAAVWSAVLGVERVGRRDNFFSLGGHSLRAVMMLGRIHRATGLAASLDAVFSHPVLADFATRLAADGAALPEAIEPAPVAVDYPLSHAQRRLWMIEQMRGAGPSPYHMPAVFRVRAALSRERLRAAFQRLLARHESLRTGICLVDGEPRQVVGAEIDFAIEPLGGAAEPGLSEEILAEFLERDFDLARPPLLRVGLHVGRGGESTLAIVMHHAVSDGWSIGVIAEELTAFYRDAAAPRPELALHYKDYAVWQARQLAEGRLQRAARYWQQTLETLPPPLELPLDRVRPAIKASRGAEVVEVCEAAAWREMKHNAEREGVSAFMALMAALQIALARQGRSNRFVIGTPVAGRDLPELEPQVGFYVNLLPIVAEVDFARSVREQLAAVKAAVTGALTHAMYPFDRLVDDLRLPRDMSRAPLFDVLMVFQNNRTAEIALDGAVLRADERASRTAQYDLTFDFVETEEEGLRLRLEYDVALFDAVRIGRLARQVLTTLRSALGAPQAKLETLEWATAGELARIRGFEQGADFGKYRPQCIHELVTAVGRASPAKVAIVAGERVMSYAELETRTRAGSARIRHAGLARQTPVAVGGARTEELIVAMLAVMRAGCVYLPLDLKQPDGRLRMMLRDAGVRSAIAVGDEAAERLAGLGLEIIDLQGDVLAESEDEATHEDVAYVIHTSGSTGRPKGVEIPHGAFATMITAQIAAFGVEPTDRCAWWASCAFDASLSEMFLALASGATVVVAEDAEREEPERFLCWLREQRVTVATLPPAFLRILDRADLAPLRVLITAGEPADPGDARHYARRIQYFNAYGPTETSVCATVQRVTADGDYGRAIPIGPPLSVASTYVLDAGRRRVPLGAPGELYVGGRIVGRGYRNAPALTAERFVADPFAAEADARMYRTGDIVRWREDGALEFIGREDGQVKIRGFRIELGDVEAAIRGVAEVRDVAVLAREWHGSPMLVAYVVAPNAHLAAVRAEVATRLPDYMRPAAFVALEALPMNTNGKLDRAALPTPDFETAGQLTPPETDAERTLAQAWQACLGVERIGRESDFFALGGDSIKALSLVAALRGQGWSVSLKATFAHPRLADQAGQLSFLGANPARQVHGPVPLLPIQKWFLEEHRDSPLHHFNQAVYYDASVTIDVARLQRAVRAVWRRHPALRATFTLSSGAWRQVIQPASAAEPRVVVLEVGEAADPATRGARVAAWVNELQSTLNLATGPLLGYGLVRGGASDRVLCLTHHLVSDWMSHRILLEDLNTAYAAAPLAPGTTELDEWVSASMAWARLRPERQSAVAKWTEVAKACASDQPRPAAGRYGEVATCSAQLSREMTARLRSRIAAVRGASLRDALLAGVARAERDIHGRQRTAVQLEGHGRDPLSGSLDVSRTVGWFTALYPFIVDACGDTGWREDVARIRARREALPDGGASYGWLRAYGGDAATPAADTRIGFNYLGEFGAPGDGALFRLADELPNDAIAPRFERDHPLDLSAWIVGDRLHLHVAFLERNSSRAELQRWLDCVVAWLETIAREAGG